MRIMWWVTVWCTLLFLQFHNQYQWFLSQQQQQQRSLIWVCQLRFPQPRRPLGVPTHQTIKRKSLHVEHQLNVGTDILDLTLHNTVNLCLSSKGLPLAPGYSQSSSSPSKSYFLSSLIEDWINVFLLACVDTIVVNLGVILEKQECFQEDIFSYTVD